jgi:UDP-N-acetylglucosamine acyltransferase
MIGGGSVLTQDIPPFCLAEGNRAVLRGLNLNGLRRRFDNREDIDAIKKAYKQIFESGKPIAQMAQEILQTSTHDYVIEFANFIINTKRGIPFNRKSSQMENM